ncbi:MAG: prepilin peptidase [Paracoccaceae bacterium]
MDTVVFWAEFAVLTVVLAAIARIDLRSFRIPDVLSLPLIAAGLGVSLLRDTQGFADHLIGAIAGFAVLATIGAWYWRRNGVDGLGLGDAKLFAAAGAWLGWQALPTVLLVASISGLIFGLMTGQTGRRNAIAFGPWLAFAFWLAWIMQQKGWRLF